MCFPICFPRFHDGQVIWALRLLMNWSMDGILALFWMRSSMRIWLMAVRYMPQCCSKHRVLMAFLLTMPAALMLTLILFSCDICMYLSKDVACASAWQILTPISFRLLFMLSWTKKPVFEWPSFSLQDSMLPAIPFTIWLVILCGVWSQRSHVSQTGPIVGRSGSADLESLESCNGYQMDHFEYDEQQLPRENSSGDLKPDFSDPFLPWLVCFSMISCWWLATGLVEGKIMQILKPSWLARTKKNGGSGFRGRFWNQSTAFVSPAVGKLTPFGESPGTI